MNRTFFLGLDTSSYTISAAIVEPESSTVCQSKKLLPVKQGELGLRQSDALFHHVQNPIAFFEPVFSADNACGIALSGALLHHRRVKL